MAKKTGKTTAAAKPAAKKTTAKPATKKTAVKKAPAKAAPKRTTVAPSAKSKSSARTTITARVDVGFGNDLYLRGEGAGLSWDEGTLMENTSPYEWTFTTTKAKSGIVFKFLINDEVWAEGENLSVAAGGESVTTPSFTW